MIVSTTKTQTLTFTVEAWWAEEGGIGNDHFGSEVKTLAEALVLLELAKVKESYQSPRGPHGPIVDWKIVVHVKTAVVEED